MARTALLLLSLVAISGVSCLRPEPALHAGHWATLEKSSGLTDFSYTSLALREGRGDDSGFPFRLLTKFIVRPSIQKEFVKGWLKYREDAKEAKGAKEIALSKPLSDNLLFYGYEEWESKADFFKYVKGKDSAAQKLAEYIEEKDIPLVLTQLVKAAPIHPHHGGHHGHHSHHRHSKEGGHGASFEFRADGLSTSMDVIGDLLSDVTETVEGYINPRDDGEKGRGILESFDSEKYSPVVLTKAIVKPSEAFRFVAAANLLTKAVEKEEDGARMFVVSKPLDDDVTFYLYAVWSDKEAVFKHLKAGYTKLFQQYVLDHDIYLKSSLLFPLEKLDE